jgi:hypothetical protein
MFVILMLISLYNFDLCLLRAKKTHHSIILNSTIQSCSIVWSYVYIYIVIERRQLHQLLSYALSLKAPAHPTTHKPPGSSVHSYVVGRNMKSFTIIALMACLLAYAATSASGATCTYDILVKTGDRKNAGTDARISLTVSGANGPALSIRSLKPWGGKIGRNYFERGNLDRFRGKGPCLSGPPCKMQLSSSGTGNKPGWFVSFVQVTQLGSLSSRTRRWDIEQWLAVTAPPRQLSVSRNNC